MKRGPTLRGTRAGGSRQGRCLAHKETCLMVRSFWKGPAAIALALMASAWGQSVASPPAAPTKPGERVITVQEPGKPALRCRVLQTWDQPGGGKAYQVKSLQTGEMLTIVAGGPSASPSSPGQP